MFKSLSLSEISLIDSLNLHQITTDSSESIINSVSSIKASSFGVSFKGIIGPPVSSIRNPAVTCCSLISLVRILIGLLFVEPSSRIYSITFFFTEL